MRNGKLGGNLPPVQPDVAAKAFLARQVAAIICNQLANDMTGEVFVIDLKTQEITPLRTSTGSPLLPDTTTRLNWIP